MNVKQKPPGFVRLMLRSTDRMLLEQIAVLSDSSMSAVVRRLIREKAKRMKLMDDTPDVTALASASNGEVHLHE